MSDTVECPTNLTGSTAALENAPVFRDHIRCLDGLRGVAVLLVLWGHSTALVNALARLTGLRVGLAYLGVEVFFVLSGFLITRILLFDRQSGSPLLFFLARRCLRIFPIYYLLLAVIWILSNDSLVGWCTVYLSNFYLAFHPVESPLSHTWSLAVEEHFYLIWPLLVYRLSRVNAGRAALWGIPLLAIGSVIAIDAFVRRWPTEHIIYHVTPVRAISLGLGAALAFHERALRETSGRGFAGLVLLGLTAVGLLLGIGRRIPLLADVSSLVGFSMIAVIATATAVRLRGSTFPAIKLLRAKWLQYIGRISYGLYLYHYPIFTVMGLRGDRASRSTVTENVIALSITLAASVASYHLIESPILSLKKRFDVRRSPANGEGRVTATPQAVG